MKDSLKLWIAQSESWQNYINFDLPPETIARYPFLERFDDFYISLFGRAMELLDKEYSDTNKNELYSVGKGLEIFSKKKTENYFTGINREENLLYASALYYLADFPASAFLLAGIIKYEDYSEINNFMSSFFRRNIKASENRYINQLRSFLYSGEISILESLIATIKKQEDEYFSYNPIEYFQYKLARRILERFKKDNVWSSLLKQNSDKIFWKEYIQNSLRSRLPIWNFFPSQNIAIEKGVLDLNKTVSLQMPTSSGKTAICELAIYNELKKYPRNKILFLAPYRALAYELNQSLRHKLGGYNIKCKVVYGGVMENREEKEQVENANIIISTPEKWISIENEFGNIRNSFSTIICDEGHLLDDRNRGLSYELLLASLKGLESKRRFIFLSAIIPNISNINSWLGGDETTLIESNYRPTKLNIAFLRKRGRNYLLDVNPDKLKPENYILNKFLTRDDFKYYNPFSKRYNTYKYDTQKTKAIAVSLKALKIGSVAVFSPQKGSHGIKGLAEELIKQLNSNLPLPKPGDFTKQEDLIKLKEYFSLVFGDDYIITKLVSYGALLHHGDLPQDIREIIEDYLRNNLFRLVICTNTLAEGVNLPIRTLVIHTINRYSGQKDNIHHYDKMKMRDLKNLFGRAGRAGQETDGLIISANEKEFDYILNFNSEGEPVKGILYQIILAIVDSIRKKRLILSNDLLEKQSENFKQLIDSLDVSLINLLAEEIDATNLESIVEEAIKNTFVYYQCNENEKNALDKLVKLRTEKIKEIIIKDQYRLLKRSNLSPRIFSEIVNEIDLTDEIWLNLVDPRDDRWLNIILDLALRASPVQNKLIDFNNNNNTSFDAKALAEVIKMWLSGAWFGDIAGSLKLDVNIVLKLFSNIINFHLHNFVSSIIQIAENKLNEQEKILSPEIKNWPIYLQHGLNNSLKLNLVGLGFSDRMGIYALSKWIENKKYEYQDMKELQEIIINNKDSLLLYMSEHLPSLSLKRIEDKMNFFESNFNGDAFENNVDLTEF